MRTPWIQVVSVTFLMVAGFGCESARPKNPVVGPTETPVGGELATGRGTLQTPIPLPDSDVLMVPFVIEEEKNQFGERDPYATTRSSTRNHRPLSVGLEESYISRFRQPERRWHNVLFRDMRTGEEWLLLDQPGVITSYEHYMIGNNGILQGRMTPVAVRRVLICFQATLDDVDGDGVLTKADSNRVIVCEPDGRRPRIITPTGTQTTEVDFDEALQRLYMLVQSDSNGDKQFNKLDQTLPYFFEIRGNMAQAEPVVSSGLAAAAEAILRDGK